MRNLLDPTGAYRNGVELTHARWNSDLQLLIKALRPHVEDPKKVSVREPSTKVLDETKVSPVETGTTSAWRKKSLWAILALVAVIGAFVMLVPKTVIIPGAGDKADAQRVAEQKALADKLAADKAAAERAAADKAAADKAAAERAVAEKEAAKQKALADKLAADRAAADKAAAEKAAAEKAAAADKAAADKAAANQKPWVGNWISADPQTRFITKLVISRKGQQIVVRAWGACHPTDCDWGLADAMDTGSGLAVHWNQGFKTADMRIQAHGDSVNVSVRSVYTDNSGRAPNTATEDFVRAQ